MMAGDGANRVLNRNNGITESRYYNQDKYREEFPKIAEQLRAHWLFTQTIRDIELSDLFRLSPSKALTEDQAVSVEEIVKRFLSDLRHSRESTIVIQGNPGTGKTVVAIFIMKLLADIKISSSLEDLDNDSRFANFFTEANRQLLQDLRIGLVVPQQSLRHSVTKVFRKTPGLNPSMVMTPFIVGKAVGVFDLLLVDETHRLSQRAAQSTGILNKQFAEITTGIYGNDDTGKIQLDWISAKSKHQIFLLDPQQGIRPADLPTGRLSRLETDAQDAGRHFQLQTQIHVKAPFDFVAYVRSILCLAPLLGVPLGRQDLGGYDFCMFDSVDSMQSEILKHNEKVGLSRMVAGFAWEWKSKHDELAIDIEIGSTELQWNSTQID